MDTRADQPGLQPDCQVIDKIPSSKGGYTDEPLPPCASGNKSPSGACWNLTNDATCGDSGFKIDVDPGWSAAIVSELEMSLELRRLGVPTPEVVAYALYPPGGLLQRSDVCSREIAGSRDLAQILSRESGTDAP